jgi:drug/metabolite transporter (DMT)-like permease
MPNPDQLATWRWLAFAILIAGTVLLVWEGKRRKAKGGPFPLLEVTAAVIAAAGWAFALPGSPLTPYLHGAGLTLTPLIVAFGAVAATAFTASALQTARKSVGTPAPVPDQ